MSVGALEQNYGNLKFASPVEYTDKEIKVIDELKAALDELDYNWDMYLDENGNIKGCGDGDEEPEEGVDGSPPLSHMCMYKNVKDYENAEINKETGKKIKRYSYSLFIKHWLQWEGRNQYERDGFYPHVTPPSQTFNLFQGFNIDKVEDYDHIVNDMSKEQLEAELGFMFQHIKYIMGNDKTEELYEYFMKYMSHLIKYPAVIPRVGWFIHGLQGSGKGQLLAWFENIIGAEYTVSTTNANNLFGQFNAMIIN